MPFSPGRTLAHYRIVRLLGVGGMGEVYEAEDLKLERRVALKLLPRELGGEPERLRRFATEAKALAAFNHPGIVTVHSIEECEGERFFVMELVNGATLASLIPAGGLAADRLVELAVALADAVAAAHACGIVHRDLKPANVMITREGRLKILDFGLAKLLHPSGEPLNPGATTVGATEAGTVMGTFAYMAPEQYRGAQVDERCDIFALGVIAYEMATGRRPFAGPTPAVLMRAVLEDEPVPVESVRPDLPAGIGGAVHSALAKDPAARPTAAAWRDALDGIRRSSKAGVTSAGSTAGPLQVPSVAVLPFADMSAAHDQEYFCDGIAEEILNALVKLEGLHVTARTSSFAFKGKLEDVREIGRRLGVQAVLEGSVRKSGDRLRITVQLINVVDGYHLWSERFDGTADDVFAVQDEIALGVVEKLKVKLLAGERSALLRRHVPSQEAYHLYLKGRYFFFRRRASDLQLAIAHFEKAIAADPSYALPHLGIAEVFSVLGLWGFYPPREAFAKVRRAAERALELDGSLDEAHASLAAVCLLHEWDWAGAEQHLRRVVSSVPVGSVGGLALNLHLLIEGRQRESFEKARRAVELEPLSSIAHTQAGAVHIGVSDFDGAIPFLLQALELDPDMPLALFWFGFCRAAQGRDAEAMELLQKAANSGLPTPLTYLPTVLCRAGKVEAARERADGLATLAGERYVSPLALAFARAPLGEKAECLDLLAQAEAERAPMFTLCLFGPGYLSLMPEWMREWFAERRAVIGPGATAAGATKDAGDKHEEV